MAAPPLRLLSTGSELVTNELDEVSLSAGSIALNGTSQYLSYTSDAAFQLGTGNFTIECWILFNSLGGQDPVYDCRDPDFPDEGFWFGASFQDGADVFVYGTANVNYIQAAATTTIVAGTWYHIALCRSSTTATRLFLNGIQVGSTYTTNNNFTNSTPRIGGGANGFLPGRISNFRFIKGTALYTTTFDPPYSILTPVTNTQLLLNVINSANFLKDGSTNNFTLTNNGTATYNATGPFTGPKRRVLSNGTLQPAAEFDEVSFDPGSWTLTGTSGAVFGTYSAFALSGDFTVEFFFYVNTSVPSTEIDFWESQTTSSFRILKRGSSSGLSYDAYGGTSYLIVADASIPADSWNHVAVSRTGTTVQAYFNGTRTINQTDATSFATPTVPYSLGCRQDGTNGLIGSISNFRLIKGTGVYTGATITVPTAPLGNITNTQLLLPTPFTGGAFFDFSTNNFLVTKISTVTSASTSPFTVTTPERLTNTGVLQVTSDFDELSLTSGAIAFSTGQRLTVPSNAAFVFGTGDFTIEAWVYLASGTTGTIFDNRTSTTSTHPVLYFPSSATLMAYYIAGANVITSSAFTFLNRWVHVALSRVSGSSRMFLNGVQTGSTYADTTDYSTSGTVYTGAGATPVGTNQLNGSLSNLRVINGTGLYTTTFTPPQAILPSITNTSLLLNVVNSANFIEDSSPYNFTVTNTGPATWDSTGPFNS